MKLYPAIDLIEGACVRLTEGDFATTRKYSADPAEVARGYAAAGAECLHIVDLDGARAGRPIQTDAIAKVIEAGGLVTQVGGGIRTLRDAQRVLDAGAARVIVGSVAVTDIDTMCEMLKALGPSLVTMALDIRLRADNTPIVATHGWRESGGTSLWETLANYVPMGLTHVLCTDIGRDGKMQGPNLELYQAVLNRFPDLQLQASGGIGSLDDIRALKAADLPGAIIGRALYEGKFRLEEAIEC